VASRRADADARNFGNGHALVLRHRLETPLRETTMGRGVLLWLIGIPLPIILIVWLLGGLHG
jgi:hypothetical protein